jgi:hypothetical protein
VGGNTLARLTLVVAHEGIKNNGKRECFAFGDLRGKHAVAVMAPPELDSLKLFVAFAFAGDAGTSAVEAPFALITDETMAGIGHAFLVARRLVLDKGTSWIVHVLGEHGPLDSAGGAPHEWCKGM